MLILILICLGLLLGAAVGGAEGALLGASFGLLAGKLVAAQARIARLEARQRELTRGLDAVHRALLALQGTADEGFSVAGSLPDFPQSCERVDALPPAVALSGPLSAGRVRTALRKFRLAVFSQLRAVVFGGNTVVRVGILVLLVGIALLLRYAVYHALFPLELRLGVAAMLGLLLVVVGYWQRRYRAEFAATLQGGGIATMYLVVFFSLHSYGLLAAGSAFALLVAIASLSAALALLQNAISLAVIGQLGGFAAPLLAPVAGENHLVLFSYYLLLNLVIVGIAYFKAWRVLNLIGFVSTFCIGSTWGALRYQPDQFSTTEPFLIAFFMIYLAIPVLFALRGDDAPARWIDRTLLFGTPLATLLLQYALVVDLPFGMFWSSAGLALVYFAVVGLLRRLAPGAAGMLGDELLAIGVGFATLAVPYAFDNYNLSGAAWALEGAALYWAGARRQQRLARAAGVALQGLAGIAVLLELTWREVGLIPSGSTYLAASAILCLAALFIARTAHAYSHTHSHHGRVGKRPGNREAAWLQALIGWGLLFWISAGVGEVARLVPPDLEPGALLLFFALSALLLEFVASACGWLPGRYPAALLLPLMLFFLAYPGRFGEQLFSHGGWFGWPVYWLAVLVVLRRLVPQAPPWARQLHALLLWAAAAFVAIETAALLLHPMQLHRDWGLAGAGLSVAAVMGAALWGSRRPGWPCGDYREIYMSTGAGGLFVVLSLWMLVVSLLATPVTTPLPYVSIVNPVSLAQLGALWVMVRWLRACRAGDHPVLPEAILRTFMWLLSALAFIWLNAELARAVHHYADVPYEWRNLWHSGVFQVALSTCWTLFGLILTVKASRSGQRVVWLTGAASLACAVIKMFLVDLSQLQAIPRIGTFLLVGMLLLLVGYLAPAPPGPVPAAKPDRSRETPPASSDSR